MKPGQPFNPRYEACGFHPEEIVARRRDLTDGQKWLYDRMVRWARASDGKRENERAGEVWRSHENMASELGKSAKQVGRDVARLEAARLMTHRKRDGRKSNTYIFLYDVSFERPSTSGQNEGCAEFDPTLVTSQTADPVSSCPRVTGRTRPVRSDLTGHPRPTNQKEFNQELESSSLIDRTGRVKNVANSQATTTDPTCENSRPLPREWTSGEIQDAREAMRQHFRAPLLPDMALTRKVLLFMDGPDDVSLWLLDLTSRRVKPEGWGLYPTDAANWPGRRPDVRAQVEAARIAREQWDAENAKQFASPPGSDEAQQPTASTATPPRVSLRCAECDGTGIREATDDRQMCEWCVCPTGAQRRAEAPDTVEQANANVLKLRRRFASMGRNTGPIDVKHAVLPTASGSVERKSLMRVGDLIPLELTAIAKG